MSEKLKILREKRGKIIDEMREIATAAEKDGKRDLTAEELARHSKLFDEQAEIQQQIMAEERQRELDRERAEAEAEEDRKHRKGGEDEPKSPEQQRLAAFRKWCLSGTRALTEVEHRALSAGIDTEGGYLVPPVQFVNELIKAVDDAVVVRRVARTFQITTAESLGAPSLDADPADADWTTELQTGSEDSTMKFGQRMLKPSPVAKRIKVSATLLRRAAMPVEMIVRDRLAYKFAVTMEKAFLTGNGVDKPLGVFTASSSGIPTSRDVSTGNTATSIGFDGLINAFYSLKAQYQMRGTWLFHRDAVKQISQLKGGDGQYLWQPSVRDGDPDRIKGRPVVQSEFAPNTFTSGLYVGMFGDWSQYWIVDALDMQLQRLVELYAESNQIGFIGRMESDAMPILGEAFARVKLG